MEKISRKSGIDILRILSMFGIIGLHIVNQGGIINNLGMLQGKYYTTLFLVVILYASVNIFGIMTGYLNVNKVSNKNKRIVELFAITIFWSILITGFFYIFNLYGVREKRNQGTCSQFFTVFGGQILVHNVLYTIVFYDSIYK